MNCTLCGSPILDYDPEFNHLTLGGSHSADICPDCLDRIIKWQQKVYARLFPTNAAKRTHGVR
ncbi:MAG: hypothetical protein HGA85_00320 [Nanoarchaeota archaeon]|nr:hypothetical protein [Nanoarchaeota archaeon]